MVSMFIGQYLLQNGHVSRDALLHGVEHQKSVNKSLGEIAVVEKVLTAEQVDKIETMQRYSGDSFEDIAIKKGFVDKDVLLELVKIQRNRNILLGEALAKLGYITMERFEEVFQLFREEQKKYETEMSHRVDAIGESKELQELHNILNRLFFNLIHQPVKFVSINEKEFDPEGHEYLVFSQKVIGKNGGDLVMQIPKGLVLGVASSMMRKHQSELNHIVIDANLEFLNMATGHFCINMSMSGDTYNAEPPKTYKSVDESPAKNMKRVLIMSSTEGEFKLGIA